MTTGDRTPLEAARKRAASDMVKIYIFSPEYECPDHYPWTDGELGPSPCYQDHAYMIPRETHERWNKIQLDWDLMNEEMKQLTATKMSVQASKGLPW